MNQLIKVNYDTDQPTVSARDLHEQLNIESNFTTWFKRMCEYGFEESKDFVPKMEESTGGRPSTDFEVSLDMAKQVCMIQRSPEGKLCRQYFIDLEAAWNSPEQIMTRALKLADASIQSLKERCSFLGEQIGSQQKVIEEMSPKVSYYDLILQCPDLLSTTQISKDYGMSAKKFNRMLCDLGIQFKQTDTWFLYQAYAPHGYTQTKTHNYADSNGAQRSKVHMYWTQKGRLFLYEKLKICGILPRLEMDLAA